VALEMPPKKGRSAHLAGARKKHADKCAQSKATRASLDAIMHPAQLHEPPASLVTPAKKSKLGRPEGVRAYKRTSNEIAAVESEGHSNSEKRAPVPRGLYVPETGWRGQTSDDRAHDPERDHTSKERAPPLGDIEAKLKGIALDDASAIAEFAMLLLSPASGSGDSIDSAVSKFCESDSQAAEIEDLRCQLRAKDDLLAQRTDHIAELEAKLDDGQLGAITTRYPLAARDIYICLHRRYLTNPRHAQATR
jgi:hypothetical protein